MRVALSCPQLDGAEQQVEADLLKTEPKMAAQSKGRITQQVNLWRFIDNLRMSYARMVLLFSNKLQPLSHLGIVISNNVCVLFAKQLQAVTTS